MRRGVNHRMLPEYDRQDDQENDQSDSPANDLPGHRERVATFAAQLITAAAAMRDVDALQVPSTTERAAALASGGRRCRTRIALRSRWLSGHLAIGMAALRAGFRFDRNLVAARGAVDERHDSPRN